jgi:choline dehydrogenase-like flavoprotein
VSASRNVGSPLSALTPAPVRTATWRERRSVSARGSRIADPFGTTRMSRDRSTGVTDPDCRVYGVDNLYLAGSSVFPTAGHANPTPTIIALSLRLADHLRRS